MSKILEREYQQQQACTRFRDARNRRLTTKQELESESAVNVDAAERVKARQSLINERDGLGLERIFGDNNLLSVRYLEAGLQAALAVCRIQIRDNQGRNVGFGTGFMVSSALVLTNHHVLESSDMALNSLAEFEFEDGLDLLPKDSKIFRLDPARFFYSHRGLDFALVAVHPRSRDGTPISRYGLLRLIGQSGKALLGEPVSIIQHPRGADKQISLRDNEILDLAGEFIHYETDTQRGSSGSPVVNDQWNVVALHHASIPNMNSNGDILNKDGDIWIPSMGDDAIDWIANEGVRISSIVRHINDKRDWQPQEAHFIAEIVNNAGLESEIADGNSGSGMNAATPIRPITIEEFHALVDHPDTTEGDLAPYVIADEESSEAFSPAFRVNSATVIDTTGLEGDRIINWLNDWSRARRHQRYRNKIQGGRSFIKIVSEGDSWFQYPILLHDVIDNLMDEENLAVFSLGAAGDHVSAIVAKAEYLDAVEQESPDYFLISGGGNDLVGGGRLATVLHSFQQGRQPEDYLNAQFVLFEAEIRRDYNRLLSTLTCRFPTLEVLCHGYDHVIPNNGRWLGKPMRLKGIHDESLQREIMRVIIDRLNDTLDEVAAVFPNVTYLDLRGTISADGWHDELHPLNKGYGDVAKEFLRHIR